MPFLLFIIIPLVLLVVILLISCICLVPQATAYVMEWLGVYNATWEAGLHFRVPFLMRVAKKVSLKEQVVDFKPQPVITRDNVTMQIDTVVFFQVTDAKLFTYGVERPMAAIENLTATTLRNIIGDLELDQSLTSRDIINSKMRAILDEATDPWGIKVNRVELKNILPPKEIQNAMEKQMKAERERLEKEEEKEERRRKAEERARRIEEEKLNRGKKKKAEKKREDEEKVPGIVKEYSRVGIRQYARGRAYDPYRYSEEGPTCYPGEEPIFARKADQAAGGDQMEETPALDAPLESASVEESPAAQTPDDNGETKE